MIGQGHGHGHGHGQGHGQGQGHGRVLDDVTVSVFLAGTSTPAKIYPTGTGGTAVYSIVSDAYGAFVFYVDTDDYTYPQAFDITYEKKTDSSKIYGTSASYNVQLLIGPAFEGPPGEAGQGFTWRGAWISGQNYVAYDTLTDAGSCYECIVDKTNSVIVPGSDSFYFSVLASKGADSTVPGPQGEPGTPGGSAGPPGIFAGGYLHTQSGASAIWSVVHNVNSKYVNVEVVDSADQVVIPLSITFVDVNNLTITFSSAISGYAVISVGGRVGLTGTGFGGGVDGGVADTEHWDVSFDLGLASTVDWAFSVDCGGVSV